MYFREKPAIIVFMEIAERVRTLRKLLGLNQGEFAQKMGIKQNVISNIETGRNGLSDANIELISIKFKVSKEWLRTGRGEIFNTQVPPPRGDREALVFKRSNSPVFPAGQNPEGDELMRHLLNLPHHIFDAIAALTVRQFCDLVNTLSTREGVLVNTGNPITRRPRAVPLWDGSHHFGEKSGVFFGVKVASPEGFSDVGDSLEIRGGSLNMEINYTRKSFRFIFRPKPDKYINEADYLTPDFTITIKYAIPGSTGEPSQAQMSGYDELNRCFLSKPVPGIDYTRIEIISVEALL